MHESHDIYLIQRTKQKDLEQELGITRPSTSTSKKIAPVKESEESVIDLRARGLDELKIKFRLDDAFTVERGKEIE